MRTWRKFGLPGDDVLDSNQPSGRILQVNLPSSRPDLHWTTRDLNPQSEPTGAHRGSQLPLRGHRGSTQSNGTSAETARRQCEAKRRAVPQIPTSRAPVRSTEQGAGRVWCRGKQGTDAE